MGIWYFAYGSNLKRERLRQRIGEWKQEQCAILKGFILHFAKGYDRHKSGYANIKPCLNSQVEGAVYLISEKQFKKLDAYEGVVLRVYRRKTVCVETDERPLHAVTYEMNKELSLLNPSPDYLNLILDGLREHGYNENVIKKVQEYSRLV